jgi:hypothetical protein
MNEEDIKQLINVNFRILFLLGYASSIVSDYRRLEAYHTDEEKCKWFFDAVQAVVYDDKPLPPFL